MEVDKAVPGALALCAEPLVESVAEVELLHVAAVLQPFEDSGNDKLLGIGAGVLERLLDVGKNCRKIGGVVATELLYDIVNNGYDID